MACLQLLFTTTISIHTAGLSSHDLLISVTKYLARGPIISLDLGFLFYSGYFPTEDPSLRPPTPNSVCRAVKTQASCRDCQRSPLRDAPRAVSKFGLPQGNPPHPSRRVLIRPIFTAALIPTPDSFLASRKRGRLGEGSCRSIHFTLQITSFPLFPVFRPQTQI